MKFVIEWGVSIAYAHRAQGSDDGHAQCIYRTRTGLKVMQLPHHFYTAG